MEMIYFSFIFLLFGFVPLILITFFGILTLIIIVIVAIILIIVG